MLRSSWSSRLHLVRRVDRLKLVAPTHPMSFVDQVVGAVSVDQAVDIEKFVMMEQGASTEPNRDSSGRKLAVQTAAGVVLLFVLFVAGALWFRPVLQAAGAWFVHTFGVAGAALGVFGADAFGVPIPPDTYLAAAVAGGAPALVTLVVVSVASIVGGQVAFWLGAQLDRWPWTRRRLDAFRRKAGPWFAQWGAWTVVVAAWTPVPFSVVSTLAGAYRMPYKRFVLSTLHRAPRMVVYYLIMALGWGVGSRASVPAPSSSSVSSSNAAPRTP